MVMRSIDVWWLPKDHFGNVAMDGAIQFVINSFDTNIVSEYLFRINISISISAIQFNCFNVEERTSHYSE